MLPRPARLADRRELVDPAEGGLVAAGHEPRPHAPQIDPRPLLLEARDEVLVEVVAREDAHGAKAALVEDPPRLDAEPGEVARVEADADRLVAPLAQAQGDLRRAAHAGQGVVGVDEEDAVVGLGPGPRLERLLLGVEGHHPAVGVGAPDRDAEQPPGEDVRGGGRPPHVRRARGGEAAVGPLRPAQAEVDHLVSAGGEAHPRRLGRDERLEVDEVEQRRLHELGVEDRAAHAHERLVGEHHRALGHRVDVALQAQKGELGEEARVEDRPAVVAAQRGEVIDVLSREVEPRQELEGPRQPAGHREAAPERVRAEEEVEDGLLARAPGVAIGLGHRELVEVRGEGEGRAVDVAEPGHPRMMRQDPSRGER